VGQDVVICATGDLGTTRPDQDGSTMRKRRDKKVKMSRPQSGTFNLTSSRKERRIFVLSNKSMHVRYVP